MKCRIALYNERGQSKEKATCKIEPRGKNLKSITFKSTPLVKSNLIKE